VIEMTDMREGAAVHEANSTSSAPRAGMIQRTLDILKA